MVDWFKELTASNTLGLLAITELQERGFTVLPGLVLPNELPRLRLAYDAAVASADTADVKIGSTTTRVNDFVNRGIEFEGVYTSPPLLEACSRIIGRPFKLSSFHGRTLRPHAPISDLHVDVIRNSADWPLAGFILMVDDFRRDNGATRFVPGSHEWQDSPEDVMSDCRAAHEKQVIACGTAGSMIVFNGSAWHGATANMSNAPRRSLQGAFIPRDGRAGTDFAARMTPEARRRIAPSTKYLLAL